MAQNEQENTGHGASGHGAPEHDALTGFDTTGHAWDGIKELRGPVPGWMVWTFMACIAFAVGYAVLYPTFSDGKNSLPGTLGWSSQKQLADVTAEAKAAQAKWRDKIAVTPVADIVKDDELKSFALQGGRAAFNENCAACHGVGGAGQKGQYPSLADDEWLWGGKVEDIYKTITYGVRNEDMDSRNVEMPKFSDGILDAKQIGDVTAYVLALNDPKTEATRAAMPGAQIFADNCAACHGEKAEGNQEMGAPNLTDAIWLYGSDAAAIKAQISAPRLGQMPSWHKRLDDVTIRMLAVYVHGLGGGK